MAYRLGIVTTIMLLVGIVEAPECRFDGVFTTTMIFNVTDLQIRAQCPRWMRMNLTEAAYRVTLKQPSIPLIIARAVERAGLVTATLPCG
jgi:hypothetical protein